jgi:hypothetical protein
VTDLLGLIPLDSSVPHITVPFTITGVSPSVNLNPFGGTILTLTGSGLPHSFQEGNSLQVSFTDGTQCEVVAVSATSIRCVTGTFTAGLTTTTVIVTVNGVVNNNKSINLRIDPSRVSLVEPSTLSPVLKTVVTITVSGYADALVKEDLEVSLVHSAKPEIVRLMNVVEVGYNGADQYIKAKFGGSESGVY